MLHYFYYYGLMTFIFQNVSIWETATFPEGWEKMYPICKNDLCSYPFGISFTHLPCIQAVRTHCVLVHATRARNACLERETLKME